MFFNIPGKNHLFHYNIQTKNTGRIIANPPRYLLNLNLNYEKLRCKNREKSLFCNIHSPYFCIFEQKDLFPEIIEYDLRLQISRTAGNLKNFPVSEPVVLNPLARRELQYRCRDKLRVLQYAACGTE